MDISQLAKKLGLSDSKHIIRKAEELRRLSNTKFDSSVIGVGEICKAVICLEMAATSFQALFDRQIAIKLSGMSEKAYTRSFNAMQNGIGVKNKLDVRELGIQFGCVRLIPFVQKGLSKYKERFLASLPASRRADADFTRPVFTAVAFYLCSKRHKLKVDKVKMIDISGTNENEFKSVSASMEDLCFDVFGSSREKKDPKDVKGHRELLDVLPGKRKHEDDGDVSEASSIDDEDGLELPSYKKRKVMDKRKYEDCKSTVIKSNRQTKTVPTKQKIQAQLNFAKKASNSKRISVDWPGPPKPNARGDHM
ncbi:origin of replication complex subunit 6-like [Papaver somniferum]|nr:origin of replication complex subunit 6-like [Papaver somniferum]